MQQQVMPQVLKQETAKFAQQWRHNGLVVPLQDIHIDFATDYANVVLRSFIEMCQQQMLAAMKAQEQTKVDEPKVILGE